MSQSTQSESHHHKPGAVPGAASAPGLHKRDLLRLLLVQASLHTAMAGVRMAAPLWALKQGYSAASVGGMLALFALCQVFLSLPAGRYADRHGLMRPAVLAASFSLAGALLATLWPTYLTLCLASLMMGGATGAAIIALQHHVGRTAKPGPALKKAFSWLSIGPAISNFFGPLMVGLLIDHAGLLPADAQGFFWAFAAAALLPALALWLLLTMNAPAHTPLASRGGEAGQAPHKKPVWDLLRQPQMRKLLWVNALLSTCWDVHTFVLPVLGHERQFSASAIGMVLGSFAVAATFTRIVLPWVARHWHEHHIITAAMVVAALVFMLYPLLPNVGLMGLCSVILGLFLGAVQPMVMSLLHHYAPSERQGEAIGLRMMLLNAFSVVMPTVYGAMGAALGVASVFWIVGAAVGTGSRWAWRLRHGAIDKAAPRSG